MLETNRDNDRKLKEICMHEKFWEFLTSKLFFKINIKMIQILIT